MIDKTGFVDIPGLEGRYAVSKNGEIYCYPKDRGATGVVKERIMKPYIKPNGYVNAMFIDAEGKRIWRMVHRIVAEVFIPNPQKYPCINHINGNKADNRIENIEWSTYSSNLNHSYSVLGREKSTPRKIFKGDAAEIRKLYKTGKSMPKIAKMYNIHTTSVWHIVHNRTHKVEAI